jgi:hypothetical protein
MLNPLAVDETASLDAINRQLWAWAEGSSKLGSPWHGKFLPSQEVSRACSDLL